MPDEHDHEHDTTPLDQVGTGTADALSDAGTATAEFAEQLRTAEDRWRRTAADLDNLRKRTAREIETAQEQERRRTARSFLPVVDGLDRALSFAENLGEGVRGGIEAVRAEAAGALRALGYPEIAVEGVVFDPQLHEAVSVVEDSQMPARTVIAVTRPGFGTAERMLRPAAVVVTRLPDGD